MTTQVTATGMKVDYQKYNAYERNVKKMTSKRKQFIAGLLTICMTVTTFGLYGGTLNVSAGTDLEQKEIKYVKVDDISPYRSEGEYKPYDEMEGYVFAGWYENADETAPIGVDKKNNSAYAKLVPKEVMNVQAQISATLIDDNTGNDESGAIRFVTTVDSNKYQEVGFQFRINGGEATERTVPTAYKQLYIVTDNSGSSQQEVYPKYADSVGCNVSKYFVAYGFKNVRQDEYGYSIEAKPFWVTLDGTTVYGEAVTKTVNQGIFGTTWTDPLNMSCHTVINPESEEVIRTYTALNNMGSYLCSKAATGNVGLQATVTAEKVTGEPSAGVIVKAGDKSVQCFQQTSNNHFQRIGGSLPGFQEWNFNKALFNEGSGRIEAYVKDGQFHLLFNQKQIYCINMVALFENYTEEMPVSIGVYGYDAYLGKVEFTDLQYLTDEKDANAFANLKRWGYNSDCDPATVDSYNFEEGSFALVGQWNGKYTMPLLGKSKTWQVKGTMERTNSSSIGMGFEIKAGDKSLKLLGYQNGNGNGILAGNAGGWLNEWGGKREFVIGTAADDFFITPYQKSSVAFRAVIEKDVLYVWFDGELCWHVPLTGNGMCDFDADSDYELSLWIQGDWGGTGQMTNLDVKMGYQVTEQNEFEKDSNGKSYTFTDTMDILQKALRLENSGMIPEDWLTGTYRMPNIKGSCLLYGENRTGECGLSTDIILHPRSDGWQDGTFISVRIGTEERLFMAWSEGDLYNNGLFYLTAPALWSNKITGDAAFSNPIFNRGTLSVYNEAGTSHVKAYVKDGYFQIKYNGQVLVNEKMIDLFPTENGDYNAETSQVSIGIGGLNNLDDAWRRTQPTFSNTTFYYGDISALVSE